MQVSDSKNFLSKLPSELSEEELLQKALSEESIEKEPINNVVAFLLYYKIEPGAFSVKRHVLHTLYKAYTKEPLRTALFYLEMNKYLPTGKYVYFINRNALDIGQKTFETLQTHYTAIKSPAFRLHFENYIKNIGIKDGRTWVSSELLFKEYQNWCSSHKRKQQINITNFRKFLKLYFRKIKIVHGIQHVSIKRITHEKDQKITEKENESSK